ncbi:hypothetical protein EDD85DRAFT_953083 [Armillaria nabsnona]|nr:hypothetical protein EDD85DRAFT_953083 [Armillaria nabsnona]
MVAEWEEACATWEEDKVPKTVFNPFQVQSHDLTEDEVHKELAEEEEACRHNGGWVLHDMSPSAFIKFGFAIEKSQQKLHYEVKKLKANPTPHQDAHIAEQCSLLVSKVKKFEELRAIYMPGLLQLITESEELDYSLSGIDAIHKRALAAAVKYRRAREAKLRCASSGDWEQMLRKLEDGDIRSYQDLDRLCRGTGRWGMNEDSWEPRVGANASEQGIELHQDDREKRDGMGQTWRSLSWIWTTAKISLDDGADENNNEEEMHRTLKFLEWRGTWWKECVGTQNVDEALHEVLDAYAAVQTDLQRHLAVAFRDLWSTALDDTHAADEALQDGPDQDEDGDSDGSDDKDVGIWDGEEEQHEDEDDNDEEALVV